MGAPANPAWRFIPPPPDDPGPVGYIGEEWFRKWGLNPPTQHYIGRDDQLLISNWGGNNGNTFVVRVRILRPDGQIVQFEQTVVTVGATNRTDVAGQLEEGFLLSVVVSPQGLNIQRGFFFVEVKLTRGVPTNKNEGVVLISGYMVASHDLGWPDSTLRDPTDGQGAFLSVAVGNPAAGSDFTYTQASTTRARVKGVFFTLVTSATAATRGVRLIWDDGANTIGQIPANGTQAASLTQVYNGGAYPTNPTAINGEFFVPLPPDVILQQNWRIRSLTNNIQVGDQFSTIRVAIEQWIDDN